MIEKHKILILICIATLMRSIIAATIGLGNDEVYYLTYAQHLQWNYFDHPPMVALLIRLTTVNLLFTSEFFIRLGPILLAAINTYLIYGICSKIKNENAGFLAALLFSCSFYSSIIAGVFILPDAPQLFFWMVSISLLIKIVSAIETGKNFNYSILMFGIVAGLCIMSKIHGVFLWIGFGLYILFYKRCLLSNGYLYASVILSLVIISPILIWNIDNQFITYTFHSNRVAINRGINPSSFFREFLGGIFYNNPINYFLIITALIAVYKNRITISIPIKRLLLLLSLPLILLLFFISLFRDTLPHWSGPAFVALIILTACYLAEVAQDLNVNFRLPKLVVTSCVFIVFISFTGIGLINYYPGTIGNHQEELLGKGDFTLDMYNWDFFKNEFDKIHTKDLQSRKTKTTFIINNKWFPGSHIDNYIAQPLHLDFIAIGKLEDIHTYEWLNKYRKKIKMGDDAYFITVSTNFQDPNEQYKLIFSKINSPIIIKQFRNKKPVRNMFVYLLEGYKGR
ncbi:glycosyltransferase family 39 protein [Flavobacterium sp. 83]|uniref:ArnT family glycosyltransferase n=1 Tax=Flavobacterium sp. 83 TaxID=1131812 RepID=UPI000553230E|nr:glycosyltransferase family 39 protein [Flavobacterium sp. 83]